MANRSDVVNPRTIAIAVIENPSSDPNSEASAPYMAARFPFTRFNRTVWPPHRADQIKSIAVRAIAMNSSTSRKCLRHHDG